MTPAAIRTPILERSHRAEKYTRPAFAHDLVAASGSSVVLVREPARRVPSCRRAVRRFPALTVRVLQLDADRLRRRERLHVERDAAAARGDARLAVAAG